MQKKNFSRLFSVFFLIGSSSCSTGSFWSGLTHSNKEWVLQPARSIEQQNLIFVSSAEAASKATAEFTAVSKALEDLANECSYVPKGTHLEDLVESQQADKVVVAVKLVVPLKICDQAKKDLLPEDLQRNANRGYAEQIQKYRLEKFTGFSQNHGKLSVESDQSPETVKESQIIHDDNEFFEMRQKTALLKESIILSKKFETQTWQEILQILSEQFSATQTYELANPALKSSSLTWSKVQTQLSQRQSTKSEKVISEKIFSKSKTSRRKPAQIVEKARSKSGPNESVQ